MDSLTVLMNGMATLVLAFIAGYFIDYITGVQEVKAQTTPSLVPASKDTLRMRHAG
jgi:uncharacterized membrane-anchored protein YitT (DUF2179 family)